MLLINESLISFFSRQLAECSPYLEALKEKNVEVLFCYEPHDELVLMHLKNYKNYRLTSVESEMRKSSSSDEDPVVFGKNYY
jgi:TNF receptor-associated protein 1